MHSKLRLSVAVMLAVCLPAMSVAAGPGQFDVVSVKVSYEDLNIHSKAGAKVLYDRLQTAAEQACGVTRYNTVKSLSLLRESRACYDEALSTAVAGVESDAVARLV